MKYKRFVFILMFEIMLSTQVRADIVNEGNCGNNCFWRIYDDGKMVVLGTGNMTDYSSSGEYPNYVTTAPWKDNIEQIKKVEFQGNIKSIGDCVFAGAKNLESITLPTELERIGDSVFWGTIKLTELDIPVSVTGIGSTAFDRSGLKTINIPQGVTVINYGTFYEAPYLESIIIPDSVTHIEEYALDAGKLKNIYCHNTQERSCTDLLSGTGKEDALKLYDVSDGIYVVDGHYYKSLQRMQKGISIKRIYTVEEAAKISKPSGNKLMIRYK